MKKKIGLILALLLAILIGLYAKNEYARLLMRHSTYGIPALLEKGEVDNLFMGSSMFRQGLDGEVLENEIDGDVYILSYNGNQPVTELIELNYLLEKNVIIHNLYVDMYAYSAEAEPDISDDKIFLETDISTKMDLWNLITNRDIIKWIEMWITSNNELILTWPVTGYILNSQFYNGGTLVKNIGIADEDLKNLTVPAEINGINVIQGEALNEIVRICKENNINLVFLDTPKSEVVISDEGYANVINDFINLLDSHGCKMIIQNRDYSFDSESGKYFIDAIHLSSEGRREFSEMLKTVL